jgi:hypothetical protein
MAAKKVPNVLFRMPNRTKCILLVSVVLCLGQLAGGGASPQHKAALLQSRVLQWLCWLLCRGKSQAPGPTAL